MRINDPADPRVPPLGRDRLWRGLVLRAEQPLAFVPWLDECSIVRDGSDLVRTLRFGQRIVRDRVRFHAPVAVVYALAEEADGSSFLLRMQIDQPTLDGLFVRFTYECRSPDHREGDPHADAIREAYRLADIDTVRRIRQLAASGRLER
ncbi:MAG: DUF1857 family protein [Proteobacteria bacterium]|nr:DUF1857 family protein [Pseudomonadota bacterium]